jgi:hypothetical protein
MFFCRLESALPQNIGFRQALEYKILHEIPTRPCGRAMESQACSLPRGRVKSRLLGRKQGCLDRAMEEQALHGERRRLLWGGVVLQGAGLMALLAGYFACLVAIHGPLESGSGIYFVDADCYSRMTRVFLLAGEEPWAGREERGGGVIRWHDFENFPEGIRSHASFPLDGLILAGGGLLGGGAEGLEMAGQWISPLLGAVLLVVFWGWAVWWMRWGAAAWPGLLVLAFSPILLHGFAVGRPDHQSLAVLLCGLAILLEWTWRGSWWGQRSHRGRLWLAGGSGLLWGVALWVTWFEPLILWSATVVFWVVIVWRRESAMGWRGEVVARGMTLAVAGAVILLEGWPSSGVAEGYQEMFWRWSGQIGELQGVWPWVGLPVWTGVLTLAIPFWLVWAGRKEETRTVWWVAMLLVLVIALMGWHGRWGYFVALLGGLGLSAGFGLLPQRWWIRGGAWIFLVLGWWPMAGELERLIFPQEARQERVQLQAAEAREARGLAEFLRSSTEEIEGQHGVLAPWWVTPSVVYWSGVPGVGGSSHQSLPGIAASARFWLSTDPSEWWKILRERRVRWVLVSAPEESLRLAGSLHPELAAAKAESMAGWRLWYEREIPELDEKLTLRSRGHFFRLWEANPE